MIPGSKNEGAGRLNSREGKEKMKVKYHIGHCKRNLTVPAPSEKPQEQGSCLFGQRLRLHTSSSSLDIPHAASTNTRPPVSSGARCGELAEACRARVDNDEVMRKCTRAS